MISTVYAPVPPAYLSCQIRDTRAVTSDVAGVVDKCADIGRERREACTDGIRCVGQSAQDTRGAVDNRLSVALDVGIVGVDAVAHRLNAVAVHHGVAHMGVEGVHPGFRGSRGWRW